MSKRAIFAGTVLIAVAFGAGYLFSTTPSSQEDRVYTEEGEYHRIKAIYPSAPKQLEEVVGEIIAEFKENTNLEALTPEDIEIMGLGDERKYTLDVEYKKHTSTNFESYVFTIYQDTLGAHPNTFYRTLVVDTVGREVELQDLFVEGAAYLERLSEETYPRVLAQLRGLGGEITPEMEDAARLGTSPSPEALQFFFVTDEALHLLFPPYQVAAYAAGAFDIAIPWSELQDIRKAE